MYSESILRALAGVSARHLSVSNGWLRVGKNAWGQCRQGGAASCVSILPANVRNLASSSDGSQSSNEDSGAKRFRWSLLDLLSVSNRRIAEGGVERLLDADSPLGQQARPPEAAAQLQSQASSAPQGPADLGEVEQRLLATEVRGPSASEASDLAAGGEGEGSGSASGDPSQQRLFHPKYGYAALGGVVPTDTAAPGVAGLVDMLTAQSPRVHPRRRFMPGDMYEPQDLNPFATRQADNQRRVAVAARPSVSEVLEKADYKNVAFLTRWFLSPAGRILPRRQTRLPVQVHRHVSRQIKLARHMGLIAGEARLDKLHLPRLREQQLAEARLAAVAEGGRTGGPPAGRQNELLDFGA